MRVCVLFGSPRRGGATGALLDAALARLGADAAVFSAYEHPAAPCLGCGACADGGCVRDDLDGFMKAAAESDALLLAAPVYFGSLPAPMKAYIDRLMPCWKGWLARRERGETARRPGVGLLTAGGRDPRDLEGASRLLRVTCNMLNFLPAGVECVAGLDGMDAGEQVRRCAAAADAAARLLGAGK